MLLLPAMTSSNPLYIAASAASQIVANHYDSHSNLWFYQHGIEPSGETPLVAPGALNLINNFLDQLLLSFLSISRSTLPASLRPAVGEVLKPRLARQATGLADKKLHEYLGGCEDDELLAFTNGLELVGEWDLKLVWNQTRLQCMVYSSLGDMEEEDEDYYIEQEHLDGPSRSANHFAPSVRVVSPAVAIFLTSILEFMGEQALGVAGQAAYHRLRAKYAKDERDGTTIPRHIAHRVVVSEVDMERVALDRTLGRLWRGWKKRIRLATMDSVAQLSFRESIPSGGNSRLGSLGNKHQLPSVKETYRSSSLPLPTEESCVISDVPRAPTICLLQNTAPGTIALSGLKPSTVEHGALPPTYLREMMEATQDTSDDALNIAPSSDARNISESHGSSFYFPAGSLSIDYKAAHAVFGERPMSASGAPQQVLPEDDTASRAAIRSTSQPGTRTSGSSSCSNTPHKSKPHRTIQEAVPSSTDRSRSFEKLIQSDQTIQYTLTPQKLRQIESYDLRQNQLPVLPSAPVFVDGLNFSRPCTEPYQSINKFRGLDSNPSLRKQRGTWSSATEFPKNILLSPSTSSRVRSVAPLSREAMVGHQSIGGFSDFTRSTKSSGTYTPTRRGTSLITNDHSCVANPNRGVNGTVHAGSIATARHAAIAIAPKPIRSKSSANRLQLEARDPVVPQRDNTSDLIDFIRQGPPNSYDNLYPS